MTVFKAYSDSVEVNGQTVLAFVNGMGSMKRLAISYLGEAGIKDIQEEGWYKQQDWLNAFNGIAGQVGKNTLKAIGRSIPESAKFPPHIKDIHSALASIDVAYHMNHRNGEIGFYHYTKIAENQAEVHCQNPYPSEFDEGIIEAMAKKFATPEQNPKVTLAAEKESRREGGESCTFVVSW